MKLESYFVSQNNRPNAGLLAHGSSVRLTYKLGSFLARYQCRRLTESAHLIK